MEAKRIEVRSAVDLMMMMMMMIEEGVTLLLLFFLRGCRVSKARMGKEIGEGGRAG